MIESNMQDLKDSLRQQGLTVDLLEVSVGSENQSEQRSVFEYEQKRSKLANRKLINRLMGTEEVQEARQEQRVMTETKIDYIA